MKISGEGYCCFKCEPGNAQDKEEEEMVSEYRKEFVVAQYECDFNSCLKVGDLMRQVQQISTDHCDFLGIDEKRYQETHTAFLMAKVSVEMYEKIPVRSRLTMVTRPSQAVRAVYYRYTSIYNEEGREVASVDSRWVLVDTETKKILRHAPETLNLPFMDMPYREHEMEIQRCREAPRVGKERATYSRTDLNRHMNNTVYADILCDYLPAGLLEKHQIKKLVVNYHREIPQDEEVEILLQQREENPKVFYSCGQVDGKMCFEAQITLD